MSGDSTEMGDRGFRLTSTGVGAVAGVILLGTTGWLLGLPEVVTVSLAGLVALVLAVVATALPLAVNLERRFRPERVTVDAPVAGLLSVTSRSRLPLPGLTAVDHVGGRPLRLAVPALAPRGSTVIRTLLPTDRRGRLALGPVRAERRDPLGLITRWRSLGADDVLWVRPRVHAAAQLPTGMVLDLEGPISDTATEGTLTFSSLRQYVMGDDLRRIHWPTTARTGELMVRTHVDTSQPRATLVLDTRAEVWDESSFEEGVEVVASLAEGCRRTGNTVDLRIVGEDRSSAARLGAHQDLDRLTLASIDRSGGVAALFGLIERCRGGGAMIVVTGDRERPLVARLAGQRRRHSPVIAMRVHHGAPTSTDRRSGVLEIRAATSVQVVAAWNREVHR
ncbi:DUF58 domain-containing protein [soil metagenome]